MNKHYQVSGQACDDVTIVMKLL